MKRIALVVVILFALTACGFPTDEGILFRTADPNLSFLVYVPQPSLLPTTTPTIPPVTIEPNVLPSEEVGVLVPDPTPTPPCLVIKGNVSSSGEKIYHLETGAYYNQVKIDESPGSEEAFFCSEEEAVAAGFRKSSR